jgi:hypothetical protein
MNNGNCDCQICSNNLYGAGRQVNRVGHGLLGLVGNQNPNQVQFGHATTKTEKSVEGKSKSKGKSKGKTAEGKSKSKGKSKGKTAEGKSKSKERPKDRHRSKSRAKK